MASKSFEDRVQVTYSAPQQVASSDGLCKIIKREIQKHLKASPKVNLDRCSLAVDITKCEMRANHGRIQMKLTGSLDGRSIDFTVDSADERDHGPAWDIDRRRESKMTGAIINVVMAVYRYIFPSKLVRAIGSRHISGRLVRAIEDSFRHLRIAINKTIGQVESNGVETFARYISIGVLSGAGSFLIALLCFVVRYSHVADRFRAGGGTVMIGIGVFTAIFGYCLLALPSRFYQEEEAGLRFIKLLGLKNLSAIRFFGCFVILIGIFLFAAPGIYWLFFE